MSRFHMLRELRRMRRLLDKLETLRMNVWNSGEHSERFAERDVADIAWNTMRRQIRDLSGTVTGAIDSLNLDASTGSWPSISVELDTVTYRDPDSGARFLVATISTKACQGTAIARDQLVSSQREAYSIDGRTERTSTIANALSAPAGEPTRKETER